MKSSLILWQAFKLAVAINGLLALLALLFCKETCMERAFSPYVFGGSFIVALIACFVWGKLTK